MQLAPGTKLGVFEIVSPLGAGGMGEVYKARDTRLDRKVAIKVLSEDIAADRRALARFRTEAKAVAALSHPNILAIHDVGEVNGIHFAVMELLDGETLRSVIHRGPLPARRALEIAGQLADALASAHEKGIVHSDVKPENTFITKDGRTKLLDFGLAKKSEPARPEESTDTVSSAGRLTGTVAYMSPEQAQGLSIDHRSDQFSLGIVLYEMLTGKRPFNGNSAPEILAAIIRQEAEPVGPRATHVPAPVRWLIERLLAKDPHGRYDTTRDLARDLRTWSLHVSEIGLVSGSTLGAGPGKRSWRSLPGSVVTIIAASILAAVLMTVLLTKETARPASRVTRLEVRLPEGRFLSQYWQPFALSPDGRLIAFRGVERRRDLHPATWMKPFEEFTSSQLFLRSLDDFEARPIPGTEGGTQPVFSPDGRDIAFSVVSEKGYFLKRVPLAGGTPATICQCQALYGVSWSTDGSILFASAMGPLQRVSENGGVPEPVTTLDAEKGEVSHRLPHLLPDGRTVIYTALRWTTAGMSWKKAQIFAQHPGDSKRSLLAEGGSDGRWVPPGSFVFAREGTLFAAPFDAKAMRLSGNPVAFLAGVSHSVWTGNSFPETGAAMLDISGSRILAWIPGSVFPERQRPLAWFDTSGKETPINLPRGELQGARLSLDGSRLLITDGYPGKQAKILELSTGAFRNVTTDLNPKWAIWGPGPDRITFTSDHEGPVRIYTQKVDAGPEAAGALSLPEGLNVLGLGSWSRDGKTLAFIVQGGRTGLDLWLLEAGKAPRPFVASPFNEMSPDISPNGRWVLYSSEEPGEREVFVKELSGKSPAQQVSVGGGRVALWSRDGGAIFYWAPPRTRIRALFRVRVNAAGNALSFSQPEKVLEAPFPTVFPGHAWDIAPDGRFVVIKQPNEADEQVFAEKTFSDRIRIDIDGLPGLLAEAGKKP